MKLLDALSRFGFYLASRARKRPITTIVLHATAGSSFLGAWATLRLKGYSYHCILPDENDPSRLAVKCVPDSRVAFHAGKSWGPSGASVNEYSLGLSFVNLNNGVDPYSELQHSLAVERVYSWVVAYPKVVWITTHYAISPGRKTDPKGYAVARLVADVNRKLAAAGSSRVVKLWRV